MNVEAIIDKIVEGMSIKTVIGEPMQIGTLTLIPIVNVSYGFGAGGGDAKSPTNEPASGSGGGGGARIKVAGVLVIKDDGVKFIQTGAGGVFDKLVDTIPDLLEKVKVKVENGREADAASA